MTRVKYLVLSREKGTSTLPHARVVPTFVRSSQHPRIPSIRRDVHGQHRQRRRRHHDQPRQQHIHASSAPSHLPENVPAKMPNTGPGKKSDHYPTGPTSGKGLESVLSAPDFRHPRKQAAGEGPAARLISFFSLSLAEEEESPQNA